MCQSIISLLFIMLQVILPIRGSIIGSLQPAWSYVVMQAYINEAFLSCRVRCFLFDWFLGSLHPHYHGAALRL